MHDFFLKSSVVQEWRIETLNLNIKSKKGLVRLIFAYPKRTLGNGHEFSVQARTIVEPCSKLFSS